ncbi:MAG: YeeE/YedE family protein [Desulfurococcales archaeon]|nr:YeeE/YedE family protein [Desulfurococcales archaeon]
MNWSYIQYLLDTLRKVVTRPWPEWLAGLAFGLVNILFFVVAFKPFTIYTGIYVWGSTLKDLIAGSGLDNAYNVFTNFTSVSDLGLVAGAFIAALLAGEYRIRSASTGDYLHALTGGFIMALGVALAWGCNWGGFLSAITALSLHGYAMLPGLIVGGFLGSRYLEWRAERMLRAIELPPLEEAVAPRPPRKGIVSVGGVISSLIITLAFTGGIAAYALGGGRLLAVYALGLTVGFIIQRSRFCFATAFRDLLGGPEMARSIRLQVGIAIAMAVGATGVALLKYMGFVDPEAYVKYVGISNFLGGILFGFGMVIAGSCASGMLWRIGEGHLKALAALLGAVLTYPFAKDYLRPVVLEFLGGYKVPLTVLGGYGGALALVYLTAIAWATFVLYLAYRRGVKIYG